MAKGTLQTLRSRLDALDAQLLSTESSLQTAAHSKTLSKIIQKAHNPLTQKSHSQNAVSSKNTIEKTNSDDIIAGSANDYFDRTFPASTPAEDLKLVNPKFETREYQWMNNCQRCVPTYEMRRRGLNVTAKPIPGKAETDYLATDYTKAWSNRNDFWCGRDNGLQEIQKRMAEWKDGARAEISIIWRGRNVGHVFIAEQRDGETVFIDPQTGRENCIHYFEKVKDGKTRILRIDNNTPSEHITDCCDNRR